jgi:hypothetical protein
MDWAKIAEWTALAVGVVAGVVLGIKQWKEKKAQSNGLDANPKRCEDHETRLRSVESACLYMSPQIAGIEIDITEIKSDVKQLINMHLQK